MKIGVLGGTFNPIHLAHVRLATECASMLGLGRVILMPTHLPPHKEVADLADAQDRLAMCRLAVEGLPLFTVSDYEIAQGGTSYTFKTLEYLAEQHPQAELYMLMGADMFLTVQEWREPQRMYQKAVLCALSREKNELPRLRRHTEFLAAQGAKTALVETEPMPMSSTEIRQLIARGGDLSELLHPRVMEYIQQRGLYGLPVGAFRKGETNAVGH